MYKIEELISDAEENLDLLAEDEGQMRVDILEINRDIEINLSRRKDLATQLKALERVKELVEKGLDY